MAIPTTADIPLVPGARDRQDMSALMESGGRSGSAYTVDAPPADVVAFYAAHFARAGEVDADATRWRFEESTTLAERISRKETVVSVRAGPGGQGASLFIGTAVTSERPKGTTSGRIGRDLARGALRAVLASVGFVALASVGGELWSATPPLSAVYFGALVVPCTLLEAWAIRSGVKVSWGAILATWVLLVVALAFVHLQAAYASGAASTATFAGGADALDAELRRLRSMAPGYFANLGLNIFHLVSVVVAAVATALSGAALAAPIASSGGSQPTVGKRALAWAWILGVGVLVGTPALSLLVDFHPIVPVVAGQLLFFTAVPACGVMLIAVTLGDAIARLIFGPNVDTR